VFDLSGQQQDNLKKTIVKEENFHACRTPFATCTTFCRLLLSGWGKRIKEARLLGLLHRLGLEGERSGDEEKKLLSSWQRAKIFQIFLWGKVNHFKY
jgi:hypothetical protein